MTGFLHSLVARGSTPGPRLRPIAAPFAGSRFSASPQDALEIDPEIPASATTVDTQPPVMAPRSTTLSPGSNEVQRRGPLTLAEAITRLTDPDSTRAREPQATASLEPPRHPTSSPPPPAEPAARTRSRRDAVANSAAAETRIKPTTAASPVMRTAVPGRIAHPRAEHSRRGQESAPDVHIHIGRIELTAIAPPPQRRQPAAAKAAMPLDEYLQRQNGRSR